MNNQLNGICSGALFSISPHFLIFSLFSIYHLLLLSISQSIICFFSILFLFSLFIIFLFLFYSLVFFLPPYLFPLFVVFSDPPSSSYSFGFPSLPLPSSSFSSSSLSVIVHSYLLSRQGPCFCLCNIYLQPHFPAYLALISSNTRRCLNHV